MNDDAGGGQTVTMNGKRDGFTLADFRTAVAKWTDYAEQAQVLTHWRKQIQRHHRLDFPTT